MPVRFNGSEVWSSTQQGPTSGAYTLLFWYNLAGDTNTYQEFFRFRPASGQNHFIETKLDGTTFTFSGGGGDVGAFPSALNTWYCAAVTVSGTSVTVRHGTRPDAMSSASGSCGTLPAVVETIIGNGVNGRLANSKVHNTVLGEASIVLELWQYMPVRRSDLLRWHHFLSADQVDYSGNGANLTGTGGTTDPNGPAVRWARSRSPRGSGVSAPPVQTVDSAGIPSAEVFGTGTVTAGPVTATSAGIPSGETFGAGQVTQAVTSAGIPSAEAHGTSELLVAGVVASAGIASAEAFGGSALAAGAVAVVSAGIPSAEVVSANSSITLAVVSAGIPSAEAHGTSTLLVGAVAVTAAGIPSAEAFGSGAVLAGSVTVTGIGIASAEAFGASRLGLTVVGVGIGTAEAFGASALLAGSVTITSAGIASGEVFGASTLILTLDISRRGVRSSTRRTPRYELLAIARIPSPSGPPMFLDVDAIRWSQLAWSETVSRRQELTATCAETSLTEPVRERIDNPELIPTELWLLRNGALVFAGPLLGGQQRGRNLVVSAGGLLTYLESMIVEESLRFEQVDQFAIAAALIDQWQALEYGHFGIDTSAVGTSGKLRDRSYTRDEIHWVDRRLQELAAVRDGFDFEIDPTTRRLQLWHPRKGVDRSAGESAIIFDRRSAGAQDAVFSVAPGNLASEGYGLATAAGSDTTLWSHQPNLELRASYGRTAAAQAWSDVSEQATLDDHVAQLRDVRARALRAPGRRVRVTPDTDLTAYGVGDTVRYQTGGAVRIDGAYRLRSRQVTVAETGEEAVDFEFV